MDDARLSRFPHLSWLPLQLEASAATGLLVGHFKRVTHFLHKARKGRHSVRCIHQGREERWDADERTVNFFPATGDSFTVACAAQHEYAGVAFAIPEGHLQTIADAESLKPRSSLQRILTHDDVVLESCMDKLIAPARPDGDAEALRQDEAARRLVLRLFELSGAGAPDWNDDASLFDQRTLLGLTAYVDEHLRLAPSLSDVSLRVGMSPSHFAKKFRHSTGVSLGRFVNRRRIWRSLETLKTDSSLASVALDLGFSSQSHFTRIFSGLTGITPAKYQKQFKRTVG
ncbi:MAG: helix-turn-helix domain-containing protein [Planctomycetia bacterium]